MNNNYVRMLYSSQLKGRPNKRCLKLTLEAGVTSLTTNIFRWQSVPCMWTCAREHSFSELGMQTRQNIHVGCRVDGA